MKLNLKSSGYFLILTAILITTIGYIGILLAYTFSKHTIASTNTLQANQAVFIANSGLEIAKRDLAIDAITCSAINGNGKYTNASLLNGKFTITATQNATTDNLANDITESSTSIPLSDASSFASSGIILVNNEMIGYKNKSANNLINVTRGQADTPIASHSSGDLVIQNQCILTAIGGIPTLTTSTTGGKRTVTQTLLGSAFTVNGHNPVIGTLGPITLGGTPQLINPAVTVNSKLFAGSTAVSAGAVNFNGSAQTQVSDGSGGLVTSSDASATQADVIENDSSLASGDFFQKYFGTTEAVIDASADHSYDKNNIDGVTGKTIWVDSDLKFTGTGTITIGSPTDPVILVVDGNFEMVGDLNINFYGFLYTKGNIDLSGSGTFSGRGAMAATGSANLQGTKTVTFDPGILARLITVNTNLSTHYNNHPASFTETFS